MPLLLLEGFLTEHVMLLVVILLLCESFMRNKTVVTDSIHPEQIVDARTWKQLPSLNMIY
jgi:hypothetical protein